MDFDAGFEALETNRADSDDDEVPAHRDRSQIEHEFDLFLNNGVAPTTGATAKAKPSAQTSLTALSRMWDKINVLNVGDRLKA